MTKIKLKQPPFNPARCCVEGCGGPSTLILDAETSFIDIDEQVGICQEHWDVVAAEPKKAASTVVKKMAAAKPRKKAAVVQEVELEEEDEFEEEEEEAPPPRKRRRMKLRVRRA